MAAKKPIKREYSAGGVVFRKEDGRSLWLVIQPKANSQHWRQGRWQLPKGWIDKGETAPQAALREVEEEGGVRALILEKIDRISTFFYDEKKQKILKNIVFFLMEYQSGSEENHDQETEKALWLPYKEALDILTFKSEKEVLKKAQRLLAEKENQLILV